MNYLKMMMVMMLTIFSATVFAQNNSKPKTKRHKVERIVYTCPMHPDETSNKSGKCSKCGMDLEKTKVQVKKMYSCPMHPEVTADKPGTCSKCGMDLTEVKKS
jgi:hypothetical protein